MKEKIKAELSSKITNVEQNSGGVCVTYETKDGEIKTANAQKLFIATGRKANFESLALENAGVTYSQKGIITDNTMKTNMDDIYAIGDVTVGIQLAHVASHQGIIAVNNIFNEYEEFDSDAVPYCIYTRPEIASMGMTQQNCEKEGLQIKTGVFPVSANGRSMIEDSTEGFSKVVVDAHDDTILGIHLAGENVTEMISLVSGMIKFAATTHDVKDWIFAHPSVSEIIHESVLDTEKLAIHK